MNDTTAQERDQADEALEALRAKLRAKPRDDVRPESEPAPSLKDAGALLKDLGGIIANLAEQSADKAEDFLNSAMEAINDARNQGSLEPLRNLLKGQPEQEQAHSEKRDEVLAYIDQHSDQIDAEAERGDFDTLLGGSSLGSDQAEAIRDQIPQEARETFLANAKVTGYEITFDSDEARKKFFDALDAGELDHLDANVVDDFLDKAEHVTQEDMDRADAAYSALDDDIEDDYEPNERVRQAVRRLKEIGVDVPEDRPYTCEPNREAHAAAWAKINADAAAEEQVRDRLRTSYESRFGGDENLAAQIREGVTEAESGVTKDLGSFTQFLDDDNLATWDRQPVPIPENYDHLDAEWDAEASAVGTPDKWDDTALNRFWLVWSNKHNLWWMQNGNGYTEHVDSAGRFTYDQAVKIVNKSSNGWTANNTGVPHTTMLPDPF